MTPDFENPVAVLRRTIKHQEKKRLEPDRQAALQKAAAEKHERESAEREAHLASLIVKESEPSSQNPLVAKPRTNRVAQARLKLRLQARYGATNTKEQKNDN